MATETVDNTELSGIVEMTKNDQNVNGAPLAIEANAGLTNPVALLASVPTNILVSHAEMPERFNETDFKTWQ